MYNYRVDFRISILERDLASVSKNNLYINMGSKIIFNLGGVFPGTINKNLLYNEKCLETLYFVYKMGVFNFLGEF